MNRYIYDNSNLIESYSGISSTLTFSFAKRVYSGVYKEFCFALGVPEKKVASVPKLFDNLVVHIGGRMYYHIKNWHRLLSFLPLYSSTRQFLEQMIGVEKSYKQKVNAQPLLHFLYSLCCITLSFIFMPLLIRAFTKSFDKKLLLLKSENLSLLSDSALCKLYLNAEKNMTKDFRIPIVNDFAVMVSVGLLSRLAQSKGDSNLIALLKSSQLIKSVEPSKKLMEMLEVITANPKLKEIFLTDSIENLHKKIYVENFDFAFKKLVVSYIKDFGSKVPGELKLESKTFEQNESFVLTILVNALKVPSKLSSDKAQERESGFISLPFSFLKGWVSTSIARREHARFRRAQIFAFAREVFLEMAQRLKNKHLIDNQEDIFYLKVEELLMLLAGKKKDFLKRVIGKRKRFFKLFKGINPPRRIETKLTSDDLNKRLAKRKKLDFSLTVNKKEILGKLVGKIASTGDTMRLNGKALVLKEFDYNASFRDKILVTSQTDPGWTIIFPLLRGVIVERGGLLSHAAVVAREYGLPCVVSVSGATDVIKNGDTIEVDLKSGRVYINET
ncbi:MAG: PEP-utilizing enzyme [Patescibacteria group bacterium]